MIKTRPYGETAFFLALLGAIEQNLLDLNPRSPPNRRLKRLQASIAASPSERSSLSVKVRPTAADTPNNGNRFQLPPRALTSSGKSPRSPVRVNCQ